MTISIAKLVKMFELETASDSFRRKALSANLVWAQLSAEEKQAYKEAHPKTYVTAHPRSKYSKDWMRAEKAQPQGQVIAPVPKQHKLIPNKEQGSITMFNNLEYSADDWWDTMSPEEKRAYVQEHPRSKYTKMPISAAPVAKPAPKVLKTASAPKPVLTPDQRRLAKEAKRPVSDKEKEFNDLLDQQRILEGYRPAIRDPGTGKIYTPPKDQPNTHMIAATTMPADALTRFLGTMPANRKKFVFEGPHVGFLNHKGKFVTRDQIDSGGEPLAIEDIQNRIGGIKERRSSINDEMRKFRGGGDNLIVAKLALAADAWWEKMNAKEKKAYIAAHPRSKYAHAIQVSPSLLQKPQISDRQKEYDDLVRKQHTLEGLRPALRDPKTGKIYTAPKDGLHSDAYDKMPLDAQRRFDATNDEKGGKNALNFGGPNSGFVNSDGEFVSRNLFDDKRRWTTEEIEPTKFKLANDIRKFRDQEGGDSLLVSKLNAVEASRQMVALEVSALRKFKKLNRAERKAYLKVNTNSIMA